MSSTPATLEAGRCADIYGCFPDHSIEGRDVEQAYISADLGGTRTYVQLPQELWTPEMHNMRCPVVRLKKALYGHKNSGAYWNEHCQQQLAKADFSPFPGGNWPSVYWNQTTRQLLVVYVDDLILSGPRQHASNTWKRLEKLLKIERPPGDTDSKHTFLGLSLIHI